MCSFKALEEKLKSEKPQIEVLINDAGMSAGAPFEDMELAGMLKSIDLNCKGATVRTKVCRVCPILSLKAAKNGRAVYITGAFYKGYHLPAKRMPHRLLVKFTGLG